VRIGVLTNLRAGNSKVTKMLALLAQRPGVVHVATDTSRVLPEALAELLQHELDVLVVNGGDGTLQYTLSELLESQDLRKLPYIAPLRGGRTNMTAKDLGAQRNPQNGLRDVIDAADAGRLRELYVDRPVLKVGSTGRPVQYGMFFGVGVIHRAISLVHRTFAPERQGAFGATLVTAALAAKVLVRPTDGILTPDKVQVMLDGKETYGGEYYLLIASTLGKLFAGMNPYWGNGPGGVRFTSMTSQAQHFARNLTGIVRGKPGAGVTRENGYLSENAEQVELRMDCGFTVDGEIFEPVPDEVVTLSADRRITFIRA
jgi:diacylglycerol kinase family enzyme